MRALGIELAGREDQLERDIGRNGARQPVQPARRGDQPAQHLGQAKGGLPHGHDEVAGQHELGAAGQRLAVDGGDPRLAALAVYEAREAAALGAQRAAAPGRHFLQVGARAEGLATGAREHHGADVVVGLGGIDGGFEARGHVAVDGVARLGAVDGDEGDVARQTFDSHCAHDTLQFKSSSAPAVTVPLQPTGLRSRSVSTFSEAVSVASTRAMSRSPAGVRAITMPCEGWPSRP